MGNRCFLYVLRAGEDPADADEIAEANNLLPTLWQLLLADAQPAPAIEDQRVFGDAGTTNIASPGDAALARLDQVCHWLRGHPDFAAMPAALGHYLDAVQAHLHRCLATPPGEPPALLSANLDELSWLDAGTPEQFIDDTLGRLCAGWARLASQIEAGAYDDLEQALGFGEWHVHVGDWQAWSTVFGLALFHHPYFFGTWDEPRTMALAEYAEEDDEANGNTLLGGGFERFREGDRWGVRAAGGEQHVTSPAQWDKIKAAVDDDARFGQAGDDLRCWVMRGGRWALMTLAGPSAGALLTDLAFEDAWTFDENGLAIVQCAGRMGFLRRDGSWHLRPQWDEAWCFAHGLAAVSQEGKLGYIDAQGRAVFAPQFDEAHDFNAEGTAAARQGAYWSLLHRDGSVIVAPCEQPQWLDRFGGWRVRKGQAQGLFHADGRPWLPLVFDDLVLTAPRQPIIAVRDGRAGLRAWDGTELLPSRYRALRAIETAEPDTLRSASFGAGLFVATDDDAREGLVDTGGRILVPFEFAAIDLFNSQRGPRFRVENARQLRVGLDEAVSGARRYGVWDIAQARLIVPCEHRHVWLVMLGAGDSHGFFVARATAGSEAKSLGKYAVRLLRASGEPMFPQTFAWFGRKIDLDRPGAMAQVREAIHLAWATGRTVQAALTKAGRPLQLRREDEKDEHA